MAQITEHINSSNHKINSCGKTRRMVVNLGSKKCENNNNSTCQLSRLQNSLLISISDTPENDLSNVDSEMRHEKVRTFLANSSSKLFSCSIRAIYNIVNIAQNIISC